MLIRSVVRAYRWLTRRRRPQAAHRAAGHSVHETGPALVVPTIPAQRKPMRAKHEARR
jgi:hypothetical protein